MQKTMGVSYALVPTASEHTSEPPPPPRPWSEREGEPTLSEIQAIS